MKRFLIALIIVLFAVPCFATVTIETAGVKGSGELEKAGCTENIKINWK